uniref:Uncharacterized protein n=1 Tax=Lepeophtheirus salmonis TaxID=72036 RepID=A0A0K2U5X4_LEPSM
MPSANSSPRDLTNSNPASYRALDNLLCFKKLSRNCNADIVQGF